MKKSFVLLLLFVLASALWASTVDAEWFVDAERFHVSVHGQLSCQDCHPDKAADENHPDPAFVNKSVKYFFQPEQCDACHSEVFEELEMGEHGGEAIDNSEAYLDCIRCHHPHYGTSGADAADRGDRTTSGAVDCAKCHESRQMLPAFSDDDKACLDCHQAAIPDRTGESERLSRMCFTCHRDTGKNAEKANAPGVSPIRVSTYKRTPHAGISCLVCHPESPRFKHKEQALGDCRQCHAPHNAGVNRDAHLSVSCGACHLDGAKPVRNKISGQIDWQRETTVAPISTVHQMRIPEKTANCQQCHVKGNAIGAASMVLPGKGILCMPCHTATFSANDPITWIAMLLFFLGILGLGSVWISGRINGSAVTDSGGKIILLLKNVSRAIFSVRIFSIIYILFLDGLLQRRLFRVSPARWLIHGLIFYPFVIRFLWGLTALGGSRWFPDLPSVWRIMDKNNPLTAFVFDLTGIMVVVGVAAMVIRKRKARSQQNLSGDLSTDWLSYLLLGAIVAVGFILEGMRMAMSQSPGGASYAFIGDLVSRLLQGTDGTDIYGFIWYLHAALTGVFIAYLPFSRLFHMIMAPVVLAINTASRGHHQKPIAY